MDKALEINYLEHLPKDKRANILDFGCGDGRILRFLSEQGYQEFVGVDIDSEVLVRLPESFRSRTKVLGDLSLFSESHREHFDFIILKDVVYYFNRASAVDNLLLILGCLRPGGTVIIEVFNGAQLTAGYTAAKDLGIQTIYTESSLRQLFESCNLEVSTIFEQRAVRKGLRSLLYRAAQKIYFAIVKTVFILERGVDSHNPKILGKSIIGVGRKI